MVSDAMSIMYSRIPENAPRAKGKNIVLPAGTGFAANQRASVSSEEIQDIEEALKKELLESFQ